MVAGIEADNVAFIGLHETLGFTTSGRLPQVGVNVDRWLDLTFMQLLLDERPAAVRRGVAGGPPGQRAPPDPASWRGPSVNLHHSNIGSPTSRATIATSRRPGTTAGAS